MSTPVCIATPFSSRYYIFPGRHFHHLYLVKAISTRLGLQVLCEKSDWQLFSMSRICDHFSSLLFGIENISVETAGPPSVPDDMDDEHWLRLIRFQWWGPDQLKKFEIQRTVEVLPIPTHLCRLDILRRPRLSGRDGDLST